MISYLDNQVGLLVKQLKELDIYDNTLIIFTSDNGPTYNGGTDSEFFNSAGSFNEGYGWTKGFVNEGGIRVPMIVNWPGKINPGSSSDHISAFWDVLPSLCDLAGIKPPAYTDGISFVPTLLGETTQLEHNYLYWEFPAYQGQQAVRMGRWKAIRKNIFKGNMEIELYDLETDPNEESNIANQHPEIVSQIEQILEDAHTQPDIERFRFKQLGDN
jgi:arylsulfatase A-like enzyme